MSYKLHQSADSLQKSFLGSDLVRSHLYMWIVDQILRVPEETSLNDFISGKNKSGQHIHAMTLSEEFGLLPVFKLPTEVGCELNRKVIQLKYDGVKSSDKIIRILFRATVLFAELCREIL